MSTRNYKATAESIVSKWPNIGMECEEEVLISDIEQALKEARQQARDEALEDAARVIHWGMGNAAAIRREIIALKTTREGSGYVV